VKESSPKRWSAYFYHGSRFIKQNMYTSFYTLGAYILIYINCYDLIKVSQL